MEAELTLDTQIGTELFETPKGDGKTTAQTSAPKIDVPEATSKTPSYVNQRKEPRIKAHWAATLRMSSGRIIAGKTEDISLSGLLMLTSVNIKPGTRAYIQMDTFVGGKQKIVDAMVEFKHTALSGDKYRCGAQIIAISKGNKRFLKLHISRINPHNVDANTMSQHGLKAEVLS